MLPVGYLGFTVGVAPFGRIVGIEVIVVIVLYETSLSCKESAYVDDALYFVEYSAKEFTLPLHAKVVPFKIESQIFDNVF